MDSEVINQNETHKEIISRSKQFKILLNRNVKNLYVLDFAQFIVEETLQDKV